MLQNVLSLPGDSVGKLKNFMSFIWTFTGADEYNLFFWTYRFRHQEKSFFKKLMQATVAYCIRYSLRIFKAIFYKKQKKVTKTNQENLEIFIVRKRSTFCITLASLVKLKSKILLEEQLFQTKLRQDFRVKDILLGGKYIFFYFV